MSVDSLIAWLVGDSASLDIAFMARCFVLLCSCYCFGAIFSQLLSIGRR